MRDSGRCALFVALLDRPQLLIRLLAVLGVPCVREDGVLEIAVGVVCLALGILVYELSGVGVQETHVVKCEGAIEVT